MDKFDLIVIGSGAGTHVASQAVKMGWNVALVDRGPTGGTCLNNGCIPSKMLIYPADVVRAIQNAKAVGVEGSIDHVDFPKIISCIGLFSELIKHDPRAFSGRKLPLFYKVSLRQQRNASF
jgi:pyruvate/2-oxoglutarate dehydrogenase complex dihydrolipoamide dehydrogenase (E3) component